MNYDWFSSSELFTISSSPPYCARTERDCSEPVLSPAPLHDHNIIRHYAGLRSARRDHRDQAFLPEVDIEHTARCINIIHLIMILYLKNILLSE